jgi:hypothetical protein
MMTRVKKIRSNWQNALERTGSGRVVRRAAAVLSTLKCDPSVREDLLDAVALAFSPINSTRRGTTLPLAKNSVKNVPTSPTAR